MRFVELVRRGGKTVQQDEGRLRRFPGLAVKEPEAGNVGSLEVHRISFSSVGAHLDRRRDFSDAQPIRPL